MAHLNAFRLDYKRIMDGEWVSPGEEYDDLMIFTRGYNDDYVDAQNRMLRKAATAYGGEVAKVPSAKQREIRIECTIEHLLLDPGVKNLNGPNGAVTFGQFCDLLRDPNYMELFIACQKAAAKVGQIKAAEDADAAGN